MQNSRKLFLVGVMLLALFAAACSPAEEAESPTEAPTAEEAATEEVEDATEEAAAPPANSAAGITELPEGCLVVILDNGSNRSMINVGRTQPSASAPTSRSYRIGDSYSVGQIVENEDGLWYELRQNNRTQGFIPAEMVGLGEGCEEVSSGE